ncbi:hypothetical protein [Campylobacter geochelonis]|uniref:hypothetical protein n=1 Tax=Campylobacter geochelonis TaxID=1780362 RepID=UPI000770737A|nr:hypothetical protein [Campylobacter geochelonis]CZE51267.1 Uncharacterized protein involved in outer membrane biogenesis [Campylobacter geochelonis]
MKFLKILSIFVVVVLVALYIILFTGFGNNLVKPYIEKIAKEKSGYDVKLTKFDLNFGSLDVNAVLNGEIMANIDGNYSLFSQSFDLNYNVLVKDLQTFKIKLNEQMGLAGRIRGKADDFSVNGVGNMLDSNVRLLATLKDFKPFDVELNAKGLDIQKALALLNKPAYLVGKIDAVANIKNAVGTAQILSDDMALNKEALKDMNITLDSNLALNLTSNINLDKNIVLASTNLASGLANLSAKKTEFNLDSKELLSDFKVEVTNLANLEPLIKQKLSGSLNVDGALKFANNKLEFVDFALKGFGGEVVAKLQDSTLNATINGIKTQELMGVVSMPKAVNGVINGTVLINDIYQTANIKGNANIKISDGSINPTELKKLANLDFPKNNNFALNSTVKIENGVVNLVSNLTSNLLNVPSVTATYDLKNKDLSAKFSGVVDDLSKLKEFTKQTLNGSVKADGEVSMKNNALSSLNLDVKALGGAINATSNGKNLEAKITGLNLADIFGLIGQEALASGNLEATLNLSSIDIKNLNGKANLKLNGGVLSQSGLSKLLNKEFPKGVKFSANADVNIANSLANFTSLISSDLANLDKFDGSYDINKGEFSANYKADIKDLSKLAFLTGKKLVGQIALNGDIKKDAKNLVITSNSDLFGGKFKANLTNEKLKATLDKFQIPGLTKMLDFGDFYEGIGDMVFNYNTTAQKGDFHVDINNGRLKKSSLTTAVSLAARRDITQQVFNDSYIKGNINKNLVDFNSMMKAPKMDLNVTKGTLDTTTSRINIPVSINIEKTDIKAEITGTTQEPKVKVSSNYLEKKLEKQLDKGLDKLFGTKDEKNSDGSVKEDPNKDIKNLIKGLF